MEPTDAVKLAYQSVFGGGHLIKDEASSLARLSEERSFALRSPEPYTTQEPFEPIGFGRARMMLSSRALATLPNELLNRAFVLSSREPAGDTTLFSEALDILTQTALSGAFSFSPEALSEYLVRYRASGCPMVSHSETYRLAYRPAYRVVGKPYVQALRALIQSRANLTRPAVIKAFASLPKDAAAGLLEVIPLSDSGR
ncbi:hypothetical protein SDC9_62166 [bioreactor metagenome]|uniref:Uncharacterized protein n=1 Tax=bioreactor metagenome TaxID=1076179 RepID=A0A644XNY5_9ZZZZ